MTKQLKTELTRDDLNNLLDIFNTLNSITDHVHECLDMNLSQIRALQNKAGELSSMFNFRPYMNEDGEPVNYEPKVLPDDANAWYWKEDNA